MQEKSEYTVAPARNWTGKRAKNNPLTPEGMLFHARAIFLIFWSASHHTFVMEWHFMLHLCT
jgi:hypothetical protein